MAQTHAQSLNTSQAVSSDIQYGLKPVAVNSRLIRSNFTPTSGSTFNPSGFIRIEISGSYATFLNSQQSYLKFTINNTSRNAADTANVAATTTGWNVISYIKVSSGSSDLEQINNFNRLYSVLMDAGMSNGGRQNDASFYGNDTASVRGETTIALGASTTFCLPLLGILGSGIDKYIPLSENASRIVLEIGLETASNSLKLGNAADTPNYTISGVEYVASIVQLDSSVYERMKRDVYKIHGNSFGSFTTTHSAGTSLSFLINSNYASAKTLFITQQKQDLISDVDGYTIASRDKSVMTDYYLTIGGQQYPSKKVDTTDIASEGYMELQKAFHQVGYMNSSSLNSTNYNISAPANTGTTGAYVVGVDLESFSNKGHSLTGSGVDLISNNLYFNCNYTAVANPLNIYSWVNYDYVLVVENGVMSVLK